MQMRPILIAGLAALALAGCGKKESAGKAPAAGANPAAADVSAASPLAQAYRLGGAEALDVDALFALFPESKPTYESAKFDSKLGATVVSKLRFAKGADGEALLVDRAELYGVDLDAIKRVKEGEPAIDAPFEKVFDKVRLFGVHPETSGDGSKMTIGAAEFDQLQIRRGGAPDGPKKGNGARAVNAVSLGGLYFKDLAVANENEASGALSLTAFDLRFVGLGGGKLAAVIAKDLGYEMAPTDASRFAMSKAFGPAGGLIFSGPLKGFIAPDNQRVSVKSFEWRGLDFSGLLAYGLKEEKPPLTAKNLVNLGTMKAADVDAYVGGKKARHTSEATISATEFTWLIPSKIRAATKGEQYDFSAYLPETEEAAIAALKKHGLNDVKASSDFAWDWNAGAGGASLKSAFDSTGLADVNFSLDLAGFELEKINAALEANDKDAVMNAGAFKGFALKIADEKLLDALFEISAAQMGSSAGELRQSAPALLRLSGAQAAAMSPKIAGYIDAVANFIAQGGTLEIAAAPAAPVPFAEIAAAAQAGPQAVPDLLALTVTHKKK